MQDRPYTVADHLLDRLAELGVDCAFGVPGDYSLRMLDHVVDHERVRWVGCTNELNAGYAADGYGRLRGAAALFTTFGVGELSAINAMAGSYAEYVPVVHVVGAPSLSAQSTRRALHHTLGDGEFSHFLHMHRPITCAQAALTPSTASAEIDRVLSTVRDQRLPGYLLVPADVAEAPATRATKPLPKSVDSTDAHALEAFLDAAKELLVRADGDVAVLAGLLVHRLSAADQLRRLLAAGDLRHATTVWAKSLVDETDPGFCGTYAGAASPDHTRRVVEDAGALIVAGVQFTDLNSGLFTHQIARERTIELAARTATVGDVSFGPVELPTALLALCDLVTSLPRSGAAPHASSQHPKLSLAAVDDAPIDQTTLWQEVARFLRPDDIVLADQGTAFYGMAPHLLPGRVTFVGQPLWASIGYTLPATLGACSAFPDRRAVLLIGDGAAQMTVQELSTILHAGLPVVVLVVDNDGYTVERAIHGPDEPYNDIARWDWTQAPALFGGDNAATTFRATTTSELRSALDDAQTRPDEFTLVQAVLPRNEVPDLLDRLTTILGQNMSRDA